MLEKPWKPPVRHRMKRVYIAGAGFSRGMGYPLGAELPTGS
jgi:hypothetical protein